MNDQEWEVRYYQLVRELAIREQQRHARRARILRLVALLLWTASAVNLAVFYAQR